MVGWYGVIEMEGGLSNHGSEAGELRLHAYAVPNFLMKGSEALLNSGAPVLEALKTCCGIRLRSRSRGRCPGRSRSRGICGLMRAAMRQGGNLIAPAGQVEYTHGCKADLVERGGDLANRIRSNDAKVCGEPGDIGSKGCEDGTSGDRVSVCTHGDCNSSRRHRSRRLKTRKSALDFREMDLL